MPKSSFVNLENEHKEIVSVIERFLKESNSKCVYLVDKDGKLIAAKGETEHIDSTSLASLIAGSIAATGELAKLMGEKEFSVLFHEGERNNLHISVVGQGGILVVLFDGRSSLGLVKLRAKKGSEDLNIIMERLLRRHEETASEEPVVELTDEDIEKIF
jgi:predicted regulator of Ras-like GTPase activity (Roadblock/LC7/MglB family)